MENPALSEIPPLPPHAKEQESNMVAQMEIENSGNKQELLTTPLAPPKGGENIITEVLETSTPAKPLRVRPALRGVLKRETNGTLKYEGKWGMNDSDFEGGIVSPFSYSRVKVLGFEEGAELPENLVLCGEPVGSDVFQPGQFSGFFSMLMNGKVKKIVEKEVVIAFSVDEGLPESSLKVVGRGKNEYGQYVLEGTLVTSSGELHVHREYKALGVVATPTPAVKSKVLTAKKSAPKGGASLPALDRSSSVLSQSDFPERQGRMRRAPSHLIGDLVDDKVAEDLARVKTAVREIMRADRDGWFAAPVDPEALGLKNYREIVEEPMDLGTVMKRLLAKEYMTAEAAVEDVRLTFNNALRYNASGDGVHTAASRLLQMFETSMLKLSSMKQEAARKRKKAAAAGSVGSNKKARSDVFGSDSESGGGSDDDNMSEMRRGTSVASSGANSSSPRDKTKRKKSMASSRRSSSLAPSAELSDLERKVALMKEQLSVMQQMQQMQGGMQMMGSPFDSGMMVNQQINAPPAAKPAISKKKSTGGASEQRAERELSYQEKRQLGADINKLPPDRVPGILQIIQEAGTSLGDEDGDEVELDIDALPTATLRKLQKHVKKCLDKARAQTVG